MDWVILSACMTVHLPECYPQQRHDMQELGRKLGQSVTESVAVVMKSPKGHYLLDYMPKFCVYL